MTRTALRIVALLICSAGVFACAGEFEYTIPAGWLDLKKANGADTSDIPVELLRDAADFRFVVVAVDPRDTTAANPGATMNAVEMRGSGRIESDQLVDLGDALVAQLRAAGYKASMLDTRLGHAGNLATGINTLQVEGPTGVRKVRQYLIPGRKSSTILTFAAPFDAFGRYEPAIAAAVAGTRVAGGGIDWGRAAVSGALAGLFGGCLAFAIAWGRKRAGAKAVAKPT